ncbi:MAG: hypothetical protein ACRENN_10945 [Candidatus Eiseniibacteriota bacterium]
MKQRSPRWIAAGLISWLVAAILVGASGRLAALRPPAPQLLLAGLTILSFAAVTLAPGLRQWADAVDPRSLVAIHLTRFVGFYFLVLYGRGELPFEFAVIGGWGDIVVAALALILLLGGPMASDGRRRLFLVWNALGIVDLAFVVATAARLAMAHPETMAPMLRLPLSLLITFLVPVLFTTHLILWRNLFRPRT